MKVAILVLAVAIVGAFAEEDTTIAPFVCDSNAFVCKFKEIGHHIGYHAKKLGGKLAKVGTSVVGAALDTGKNLLVASTNAVLKTILDHMNQEGLVGKREVLFDKVKAHLADGFAKLKQIKERIHAAYKKAVEKLTGMIAKHSALKGIDENTDKKIDEAVEEFKKDGKKGFFNMAKTIAGKIREIFQAGMEKLREKYGKKVATRGFFDGLKDAFNKAKDHLTGVAGDIANSFKPHLDNLKQGITDLGNKAKEHAGKLVGAAKDKFDELKTKVSDQVEALKGQAANLGSKAADAAKQSIDDLKKALSDLSAQAVGA